MDGDCYCIESIVYKLPLYGTYNVSIMIETS